jgi:predicted transposase/invertase (TIGR01784 family)
MGVYDSAFKKVFSDKQIFFQFIDAFVPEINNLDIELDDLFLEETTFTDPNLSDKEDDILYRIRYKGKEIYIYILIEHQSSVDYLMPYRILVYMTRIWERYVNNAKDKRRKGFKLPPIIPIVFYNGMRKWTAEIRFEEKVNDYIEFAKYVPHFYYLLVDVGSIEEWRLKRMNNALSLFLSLDAYKEKDVMEIIEEVKGIFEGFSEDQKELVRKYIKTYLKVLTVRHDMDVMEEESEFTGEVNEMLTIFSAKLKENLKREREEGIEEGILESTQEAVIDVVEAKFDEVPKDIAKTIKEINDIDVLKDLLKKAIKSETLNEFSTALKAIEEK